MRTRLSINDAISSSLAFAILAWCLLSLPIFDSYGLTNFIIIHSVFDWVVIAQRVVHLAVLFAIIYHYNRSKFIFWYDDQNLFVEDRKGDNEQIIPFKTIISVKMKPVLLKIGSTKFKFTVNYLNSYNQDDSVDVMVRPGKAMNGFMKVLYTANPTVEKTDHVFY